MTEPATLRLRPNEERRLLAGHLWIYSNEVDTGSTPLTGFQPGERLVWARNPHFGDWNVDEAGNALPYLDGRIHRIDDRIQRRSSLARPFPS